MSKLDHLELHEQLKSLTQPFPRFVMMNLEHEILHLKFSSFVDIGTLPQSVEVSHKYLQLQDADIVLTNDPYSGGALLSSPTLVLGIGQKTVKGATPAEFLCASRLTLPGRVGHFKTIDDEGLRIPPSPLFIKGQLNTPIVEALKTHPQTPKGFIEAVLLEAEKLLLFRKQMKDQIASQKLNLGKARVKAYLAATNQSLVKKFEEFGEGAGTAEVDLSEKENIKLKVEHFDNHFLFDFTGTAVGENFFMTDTATLGTVIGTLLSYFPGDIPLNSGVHSLMDLRAPRGSIVNSAFPRSVHLGHTDGVHVIANLVSRALGHIHKKWQRASSGPSHCAYEIVFPSGEIYTDALPVGMGAGNSGGGTNGTSVVDLTTCDQSVEKIEQKYPLQFMAMNYRSNSAGTGLHEGGSGVVKSVKVLEGAQLRWAIISPLHKPEGAEGGKSALSSELHLIRADGQKEILPRSGMRDLHRGDVLSVHSAGGGGYGIKAEKTEKA